MGAFDLSSGYAAGGGADALESLWKLLADNADMEQRRKLEQQRIALEQQRVKNESDYKNATLASMQAEHAANEKLKAQQGADKLSEDLTPNSAISDATAGVLDRGDRGDLYQKNPALPTRSIRGILRQSDSGGPMAIEGLQSDINPTGLKANNVYLGTAAQKEKAAQDKAFADYAASAPAAQQGRLRLMSVLSPDKRMTSVVEMMKEDAKPAEHSPAYKEWQDAVANGYKGNFTQYQNDDANRRKSPPAMITVQTVDANGNAVTKVVPKTAGSEFVKPANATTATRVASAETVNQVGSDLIAKLSDPKFAAVVGPAMGRAGTLRDFIGNPPPEFSELAGQIESYALANMGVHGMRSTQGAEQIKKLLDAHHTPESLAATIRGLNDFSTRFVQNNKPKAGGGPAAAGPKADPLGIR